MSPVGKIDSSARSLEFSSGIPNGISIPIGFEQTWYTIFKMW